MVMATITSCLVCVNNYLIPSSSSTYEGGAIITPSLQARDTGVTQSSVAGQDQSQDWNQVLLSHCSPISFTIPEPLSHLSLSSWR